jgi:2-iminobutanoate/2-iminopropanoate deaminase
LIPADRFVDRSLGMRRIADGRTAGHKETPMTVEQIRTQPDPYEPFLLSQGIRVGELLFISGQAGYSDKGHIVEGGFRAQGE